MAISFGGVNPIFCVADLRRSLDYYVNTLGFKIDWGTEGGIACVSRGNCAIFLCQGDQGHPGAWVWIAVGDADALHDELRAKGATIRHPPTNYQWALEMQVKDPDGNVLRFGSEPKKDAPLGPWLDMHGTLWTRNPEGGWTRS